MYHRNDNKGDGSRIIQYDCYLDDDGYDKDDDRIRILELCYMIATLMMIMLTITMAMLSSNSYSNISMTCAFFLFIVILVSFFDDGDDILVWSL